MGETRVLTGLVERRALESEFARLAEATSPQQLAEQAAVIAAHGPAALSVLTAALDTGDPHLRAGLGEVARRLPRDQVVTALRAVAHAASRGEQARITALILLERYLGQPLDDALLAGLDDPAVMGQRSLSELAHAMDRDPLAIVEYLSQLAEQPPEVVHMILAAVARAEPSVHLVTLLSVLAQDPDEALARGALEQLSRTRTPAAMLALTSLAQVLPPALAALAARGARKLRMSGVAAGAAGALSAGPWLVPGRAWRALVSPVDGAGAQLLLFVGRAMGEQHAAMLTIVVHQPLGVQSASGSAAMAAGELPPSQPAGHIHRATLGPSAQPLLLLEAPLSFGRQVLREALALNWASGAPTPPAYRLFGPLLWLDPAEPDAERAAADARERHGQPPVAEADVAVLLDHPAFLGWYWRLPESATAGASGRRPEPEQRSETITDIARRQFVPEVAASYAQRLRRMSQWLELAGEHAAAAVARAAAAQMDAAAPEESLFVRRLIGLGLEVAAAAHRSGRVHGATT